MGGSSAEGRTCTVLLNGEATLKRIHLRRRNGRRLVTLRPENTRYEPEIVDETDDFRVTGVALCLVERRER